MKLVLAAKSLPLKGINLTMKCSLLMLIIAALVLPTAVNAETWWLLVRGSEKQTIKVWSGKYPQETSEAIAYELVLLGFG